MVREQRIGAPGKKSVRSKVADLLYSPGHIILMRFNILGLLGSDLLPRLPLSGRAVITLAFLLLITVKFIIVVIRHQIRLDMVYGLLQKLHKAVEIFLVQENFVTLVTITMKLFGALRKRKVVIISLRPAHIKEVSPTLAGLHLQ